MSVNAPEVVALASSARVRRVLLIGDERARMTVAKVARWKIRVENFMLNLWMFEMQCEVGVVLGLSL